MGNMKIGYARVSTADQHLRMQEDALKKAGCDRIYHDIASGVKTERPGLEEALNQLRQEPEFGVFVSLNQAVSSSSRQKSKKSAELAG